jgi:hypothetical protein
MPGDGELLDRVAEMASRFAAGDRVVEVEPFRGGHIHSSFLVTVGEGTDRWRILLQRFNDRVFVDPKAVDRNIRSITGHLRRAVERRGGDTRRRVLELLADHGGKTTRRDSAGCWWRAYRFVEDAVPADAVTEKIVERAAWAYGDFQRSLIDYDGPRLSETIPGFHDTPRRLDALESAVGLDSHGRLQRVRSEVESILDRRSLGEVLTSSRDLPERIVHNDAKLDNVLFDAATGDVLCVVDLDTVMPGCVGYDFGDMVRSMSISGPEDTVEPGGAVVRDQLFGAVVRGYLRAMGGILTSTEVETLVPSGIVLTLEQAARFLTDFLSGDTYYRVEHLDHNLDRTRAQLDLLESLLAAGPRLEAIVDRELGNVERSNVER